MTTTTKPDTALVPTLPATCEVQGYTLYAASQRVCVNGRVSYEVSLRDAFDRVVLVALPEPDGEGEVWVGEDVNAFVPAPAVYAEAQRVVREMWGVSL